jgi:hypothetical protein
MEAVGLAASITTIVRLLQRTYETLKDAPAALEQVLAQANSLAALVTRLDSIEPFLSDDRRRFLASQFDRAACARTVDDLKTIVNKISETEDGAAKNAEWSEEKSTEKRGFKNSLPGGLALKTRVMWFLKESNAKKLSERMKTQCEQIANATHQILMSETRPLGLLWLIMCRESNLFMEKQLAELREAMLKQSKPVVTSTHSTRIEEPENPSKPIIVERQEIPIWLGQYRLKQGQTPEMPYFNDRDELTDSAYWGNWDDLLTHNLAAGDEVYNHNWINARKILEIDEPREPSGYTPLHQAAWHGASTSVVEELILLGAWRLARTWRNEQMLTPLDLAKRFGWAHLYSLLTPVVHHTLPASVLVGLQTQLDEVFEKAFPGATKHFRIPQVEILTELEYPQLLVPLDAEKQNVENPIGMRLFLDQRELVAQIVKTDGTTGVYRIRKDSWDEIERGILLHYQQE